LLVVVFFICAFLRVASVKDETTKSVTGSLSQTAKLDENNIQLIKRIDVEKRELKNKLSYFFCTVMIANNNPICTNNNNNKK
jgi:hypothetical protein